MRCSPVASSPSWETSKPRWPTTYASRSVCSRPPTLQPPITVFIASPGGNVRAGLAIYDTMRLAACPIHTVCLELAASMGAIIFMGGDDRRMAPHAELMIHDPLIPQGAGGSALALQETSRRLMQTRKTLTQILSDRSGLTPKRIQSLTAKDTYLSAERAVELGFAHEILSTTKEVAHV